MYYRKFKPTDSQKSKYMLFVRMVLGEDKKCPLCSSELLVSEKFLRFPKLEGDFKKLNSSYKRGLLYCPSKHYSCTFAIDRITHCYWLMGDSVSYEIHKDNWYKASFVGDEENFLHSDYVVYCRDFKNDPISDHDMIATSSCDHYDCHFDRSTRLSNLPNNKENNICWHLNAFKYNHNYGMILEKCNFSFNNLSDEKIIKKLNNIFLFSNS